MKTFNLSLALTISWLAVSAQSKKPNIILFMADDMGIGDTSAYLGVKLMPSAKPIAKTLKTPNIERFAKQGMIFTDAHAPASMCSSTRYSLLTGRLSHRSYLKQQGWLPHGPNRPMIQRALTTLPEMLKRNGYATAAIGKYHVGMDFDDGHWRNRPTSSTFRTSTSASPSWTGRRTMASTSSSESPETPRIPLIPSPEFTCATTSGCFQIGPK